MIGYHSAVLAYKIVSTGKPEYLAKRLKQRKEGVNLREREGNIQAYNQRLSISKEAFLHRGACLLNKLGDNLRNETKLECFKTEMKKWAKKNISTKPKSRHPQFSKSKSTQAKLPDQEPNNPQDIRRFLVPRHETPPPARPQPTDRPPPTNAQVLAANNSIRKYFSPVQRPSPK